MSSDHVLAPMAATAVNSERVPDWSRHAPGCETPSRQLRPLSGHFLAHMLHCYSQWPRGAAVAQQGIECGLAEILTAAEAGNSPVMGADEMIE
jgi:hypothetical protein